MRSRAFSVKVVRRPAGEAIDDPTNFRLGSFATAASRPRSPDHLGDAFARWATEGQACQSGAVLHGLKKGDMRRFAEAGATGHEIMGISGHRTLSEIQRYTADRKKLAASGMWKKRRGNEPEQDGANPALKKRQPAG